MSNNERKSAREKEESKMTTFEMRTIEIEWEQMDEETGEVHVCERVVCPDCGDEHAHFVHPKDNTLGCLYCDNCEWIRANEIREDFMSQLAAESGY